MDAATWDLVRRRFYLWTLTLTLAGAGLAGLWGDASQAWSLVAGAVIGVLNLSLLAGAAYRLVRSVQASPQLHVGEGGRAATAWALVRWPVAALATAAVLWYMPGRPEGLTAGVFVALAGFCVAALHSRNDLSRDDEPASHEDPPPDR